jgi:hypothetical protein
VAITLLMLVMGSIFACWKVILSGTRVGQSVAAAAQRSRASMRAVEDSLNNIEISKANLRYYYFLADTSEPQFASVSFAARLPTSFLGSDYYGDRVLRRVTFDVERDAEQNLNLVMTQYPLLDIPSDQNPPKSIILARDVSAFVLEFWSPKDDDWMTDFDLTNEVPPMIRVTLGTGHSAQDSRMPLEIISRIVVPTTVAHN